jgi:hypothetical protein
MRLSDMVVIPTKPLKGETDDYGLPVRYNWAAEYRGTGMIFYGHTPGAEPWVNRTIKATVAYHLTA